MYLLSEHASMVNVTIQVIDGGLLCNISVKQVKDVIYSIMYLLSEHASMVNGTLQVIDGGLLCNIPV